MIRLEKAGPDAAQHILSILDNEGVAQTGSLPMDADLVSVEAWLDGLNRRAETRLVVLEETGEVVGFAGLWNDAPVINLGYYIRRSHAGRGIASRTAAALVQEALSRPDILRITAVTFQSNPTSRRVLEKTGFLHTGAYRDYLPVRGGDYDHWTFEYLISDPSIRLRAAGPDAAALLLPFLPPASVQELGSIPAEPGIDNLNAWLDTENRRSGSYLIEDIVSGDVVGYVGLSGEDMAAPALTYIIDPARRGEGIATRAARLALQDVLRNRDVTKIMACAFHRNPASRRVLEKLGFRYLRDFVSDQPDRGGNLPSWLFELVI